MANGIRSGRACQDATLPNHVGHNRSASLVDLDFIADGSLSESHAEDLLKSFRQDFIVHFPFLTISQQEDLPAMRRERPMLLQSLLAVGVVHDIALQRKLGAEVAEMISGSIRDRSVFSLDLLQAVLVHAAWYQFFFHPFNQQFGLMVQYCIFLSYELGLDRTSKKSMMMMVYNDEITRPDSKAVEGHRALLGTYYLSST